MQKSSTEIYVSSFPNCDLCKSHKIETVATYDALTVYGPWAYLCESHFQTHGIGLGTGQGQKLILRIPENS